MPSFLACGRSHVASLLHRRLPTVATRGCSPSRTSTFSSSALWWRASAAPRSAVQKSAPSIAPSVQASSRSLPQKTVKTPSTASYNPLIQQLANRQSPILIYQSQTKAPYVTGCFVLGGICVAYGLHNAWIILFDPMLEDPSTFVKVTFGVVCTAMMGFGAAMFYKTFRIVRSISVVPTILANGRRSVSLRLESGNLRSKFLDVPYAAVSTSKRMFMPANVVTAEEQLRKIEMAKKRREYERQRIMTLPFRQAGQLFSQSFQGFKSVVSDDNWIFLRVNGRRGRWKIYEKPAWALRNGKHLDDLTRRM